MAKKRGLTLIELLVTITIMVLLMTVGMVGFRSSQKKHELKDNALEVKDIIDRTRLYALAPRVGSDDKKIYGYCVRFTGGDGGEWRINEYSVASAPRIDDFYPCDYNNLEIIEQGNMPSYINIKDTVSIGFATARWEGASVTYDGAGRTDKGYSLTVAHTKTTETKTISVTKDGITNVQ